MNAFIIIACLAIATYVVIYRMNTGETVYKYISRRATRVYEKYAPY